MPTNLTLFQNVMRKLLPAEVDQNFLNLRTTADAAAGALGGFSASQAPGAGQIPVKTAGDNLVLATGRVLLGTTTDDGSSRLQVAGSGNFGSGTAYSSLSLSRSDQSGAGNLDKVLLDVMTATGAARLLQLQGGSTKNEIRLYPSGVTVAGLSGNFLIGTAAEISGGGCLQLKSGVTFPATQVASANANTLDDYEEGTWTPVVVGSAVAGAGTYTLQYGTYTKIGRLVLLSANLTWTAHTGTGTMSITGMPFPAATGLPLSVYHSGLTVGAGKTLQATTSGANPSVIYISAGDNGGGAVANLDMDSSVANLIVSGCYIAS